MNIYFSGSIKGADHAKENYPLIISELKKYGVVLIEHIGKLAQGIQSNVADSPIGVFETDRNFIDHSDIVIAEVSAPSLGVGWELAYAQYVRKIPIYCFHVNDARVSRMILGNSYISINKYNDIEEIQSLLKNIFSQN